MTEALVTTGLTKRYGALTALAGVDLTVQRGEVFGFLGPNGAGKTTFTKCVTGFIRPTAGHVRVFGLDVAREPVAVARRVGLVPDQYDFYPTLTGREHLDFYGRLNGMDAATRRRRIDEVLTTVRMTERADSRVKTYSHGMKQRIAIAQAILHEPELILFDEPTNGLDPKGAYEMRMLIKSLAARGTTVFLSSHILHEVELVCERVAIMDRGHLKTVSDVASLRRASAGGAVVTVRLIGGSERVRTAVAAALDADVAFDGERLTFTADEDATAVAVAAAVQAGGRVVAVTSEGGTLESAFLRMTGGEGAGGVPS